MNQSAPSRSPKIETQKGDKALISRAVGLILLITFAAIAVFSLFLGVQTSSWQPYAVFGVSLAAIVASLAAILRGLRGRYDQAGALMIASLSLVAMTGSSLYVGIGLPFGFAVLILIMVIAILLLPARWATWVILAGVVFGITCGSIDLLSPAMQIEVSTVSTFLIGAGAVAVVALSAMTLWQFRSLALVDKLLVAFLSVTLLAAGIIAFLSAQSSTRSLTASIGMLQYSLAGAQANTIGDLLDHQVELMESLSLDENLQDKVKDANLFYSGDLPSDQAKVERFDEQWKAASAANDASGALVQSRLGNTGAFSLRSFAKDFTDHVEVFITDRMGGVVAATNMTSDYNQADEGWWQTAWNGGKGNTYLGSPEFDESAGVTSINIAIPVRDQETQEVVGVLRTTYVLDALHQFVGAIRENDAGDADLLFPGEPAQLMQDEGGIIEPDSETIDTLEAASAFEYSEITYEGNPVLLSQAVVKSSSGNPAIESLGWRMIVNQDLEDALAPVRAQTRSTIMATMLVIGLVVGAAILSAQVLTRPITHLTAVATRIREGDLNTQAEVETQDEIGVLASTFNDMTSELRNTLEGLEVRVAERTRELAVAGEVSNILSQELDLGQLLKNAVELVRERFDLYYTQIYLYQSNQRSLTLRAGSGAAGIELERRGHRLPVSVSSINGKAAMEKAAVVVQDVTQSPNFRPNALLPETRSEAAVPMLIGDRLIGILDLQSSRTGDFDPDSLPAFNALAGQLAVAVENATIFAQVQEAKKEVDRRIQAQTRQGWQDYMDAIHKSERVGYLYEDGSIRSSDEPASLSAEQGSIQIPIEVSGEVVGSLAFQSAPDRVWLPEQVELVEGVAAQVGRQIDNLRLLDQAERYRLEAEETARRLTQQGWEEYEKDLQGQLGFVYDQMRVHLEEDSPFARVEAAARYPLAVHNSPIGMLEFEGDQPLKDDDLMLIQTVAESLSSHIDSLRLTAQTRVALNNMETLNEVTRAASRTLDLDNVLQEILGRVLEIAEYDSGLISIEDPANHKLGLAVHHNLPEPMVNKLNGQGFDGTACDVVFRSGDTFALADLRHLPDDLHATNLDDRYVQEAMKRSLAAGFQSYMGLALISKGQILGTVCIFNKEPKSINPSQLTLLSAISQQVGILIDNARLFQSTQKALSQTEVLYAAIAQMNQAGDYNDILAALVDHTPLGQADQLLLMGVFDHSIGGGQMPKWIYPVAWRSARSIEIERLYPAALMAKSLEEQQTITSGDLSSHPLLVHAVQEMFKLNKDVSSASLIPLMLSGQVIGFVLGLYSQMMEPRDEDVQRLKAVTGQAAIAVESRLLLEQAQTKARQEQRLREVSANVFAASDVDAILRRAVEQVGRTLSAQAYIYLGKEEGSNGKTLDGSVAHGPLDAEETPEESALARLSAEARQMDMKFLMNEGWPETQWIAVSSQKGGVGKTTTCLSLGASLVEQGYRVLLVDLDPQGNLTQALSVEPESLRRTIGDALLRQATLLEVSRETATFNLDLVPANRGLILVEKILHSTQEYEFRLKTCLEVIRNAYYDVVLFDCPPSFGPLTINALAAATTVIVPITCDYYSLRTLQTFMKLLEVLRDRINLALHYRMLVTLYDGRTRLSKLFLEQFRLKYDGLLFDTVIPLDVKLRESPMFGRPVNLYATSARGAQAYRALSGELITCLEATI